MPALPATLTLRPAPSAAALAAALALAAAVPCAGQQQPTRIQSLELSAGWNAVFLEVEPLDADPAAVFGGLPVDIVARYFPVLGSAQFISDPAQEAWKSEGWGVWYAPHRDDAFLTSLHHVHGNTAYLVRARESARWQVEGAVTPQHTRWRSGRFNLVGFSVDPDSPPTFAEFFAASHDALGSRVFRLTGGTWRPVDPTTTTMRPGEACWIHCPGKTSFQGPIAVRGQLAFARHGARQQLRFHNPAATPQSLTLTPPAGTKLERASHDLQTGRTSFADVAAPANAEVVLAPGETTAVTLRLVASAAPRDRVLKVSDGRGALRFLPITDGEAGAAATASESAPQR